MKKRILSILLIVSMLLVMLPVTAMAEEPGDETATVVVSVLYDGETDPNNAVWLNTSYPTVGTNVESYLKSLDIDALALEKDGAKPNEDKAGYWKKDTFVNTPLTVGSTDTFTSGQWLNVIVYYDHYYDVTFDSVGGSAVATQSIKKGSTATAPTPTKTGHTFKGWYTSDDQPFDFATKITEAVALTAKWDINHVSITAKLYLNGQPAYRSGNNFYTFSASGDYGTTTDLQTLKDQVTARVQELDKDNAPSRIKVTLKNDGGNVTYTSYTFGAKSSSGFKVYADTYYKVTFNSNGGSEIEEEKQEQEVAYNTTVAKPSDPTRTGYTFGGWYDGDTKVDLDTPVTKTMALTAKWTLKSPEVSVTPNTITKVYDGEPVVLTATATHDIATPKYQWQKRSTSGWPYVSGATSSTYSVTNVADSGKYRCMVSVTVNKVKTKSSAETTVKITPLELTSDNTKVELGDALTYNTEEQTQGIKSVTVTTEAGKELTLTQGTDYEIVERTDKGTDAGEYTMTLKGKGNFTGSITVTWSIAKSPVEAPTIDSKAYTGDTLTATISDTDYYTVTANAGGTNVGDYDVGLTLKDSDNYEWAVSAEAAELGEPEDTSAAKTLTFTITPAEARNLGHSVVMVKNHANYTVEIDLTTVSNYPTDAEGTPTFAITNSTSNGLTSATLKEDGKTLVLVSDKTQNDTDDTVTISLTGMKNYKDSTITVTVSYKDKTVATITGVETENGTYSGRPQTGYTGTPTSAYSGDYDVTYTGTQFDGTDYAATTVAPTNAGNYQVTFKVPDSSVEYAGTCTVNFTIAKAPVVIHVDNKSTTVSGKMPELTYSSITGLIGDDTLDVQLSTDANLRRVGVYPIYATADGGNNYTVSCEYGLLTVAPIQFYKVIRADAENGTVTTSANMAYKGATVVVTVTPKAGYKLDTLTVTPDYKIDLAVKSLGNGKYSFTMPSTEVKITATFVSDGTVSADTEDDDETDDTCPSEPYTDLDTEKWYHEYVDYVLENGIMNGYNSTTFGPNNTLTRAELAQILYNQAGQPAVTGETTFTDVNGWYKTAVIWAAQQGLVEGYEDGTFKPTKAITRQELATILWRAAGKPASTGDLSSYQDAASVSAYAKEALQWATANGIVSGKENNTLDPKGNAKRCEAAKMIAVFNELTK
jgi:uncharacterized repeat protein (TIGR02543 family)